jgi:hypothetical protein
LHAFIPGALSLLEAPLMLCSGDTQNLLLCVPFVFAHPNGFIFQRILNVYGSDPAGAQDFSILQNFQTSGAHSATY